MYLAERRALAGLGVGANDELRRAQLLVGILHVDDLRGVLRNRLDAIQPVVGGHRELHVGHLARFVVHDILEHAAFGKGTQRRPASP